MQFKIYIDDNKIAVISDIRGIGHFVMQLCVFLSSSFGIKNKITKEYNMECRQLRYH